MGTQVSQLERLRYFESRPPCAADRSGFVAKESAGRACGILNPARLERRIVQALWLKNPQGELLALVL